MTSLYERLGDEAAVDLLSDSHFDAVLENLGAALSEPNVPAKLIAEAAAVAESLRHDVPCK